MEWPRLRNCNIVNRTISALIIWGLLMCPTVAHAQFDDITPPLPIGVQFDNYNQEKTPRYSMEMPSDPTVFEHEEFEFPIQIVYEVEDLNYITAFGPIKTCDQAYDNGVNEAQRVCAAVGITQESNLTPQEEMQEFENAAREQLGGLNRAEIDSKSPLRYKIIDSIEVGEYASCLPGRFCLRVKNLLHPSLGETPYLGVVEMPPLGVIHNNPPPANVDYYASDNLEGCAPNVPKTPAEIAICNGEIVYKNGVTTHEKGHVEGLPHTHNDDGTCKKNTVPGINPSTVTYFWGCPNGTTSTVVDTCRDAGIQFADPVTNTMSYSNKLLSNGTYNGGGKSHIWEQNMWRLQFIRTNYPEIFTTSRRSSFEEVVFEGNTILAEAKVGTKNSILFQVTNNSGDYEFVYYPPQGVNEPSSLGETTIFSHTTAVESPTEITVILYTNAHLVMGSLWVYDNYFIKEYGLNESGQPVLIEEISNQQPFTNEGGTPSDGNICVVTPASYEYLPVISK